MLVILTSFRIKCQNRFMFWLILVSRFYYNIFSIIYRYWSEYIYFWDLFSIINNLYIIFLFLCVVKLISFLYSLVPIYWKPHFTYYSRIPMFFFCCLFEIYFHKQIDLDELELPKNAKCVFSFPNFLKENGIEDWRACQLCSKNRQDMHKEEVSNLTLMERRGHRSK